MYKFEFSFNYIVLSLEIVLIADVSEEESLRNLSIVIIYEYDFQLLEKDSMKFSQKGQDFVRKYGFRLKFLINICLFLYYINVSFFFVYFDFSFYFI